MFGWISTLPVLMTDTALIGSAVALCAAEVADAMDMWSPRLPICPIGSGLRISLHPLSRRVCDFGSGSE
jgi:hypothetical protein